MKKIIIIFAMIGILAGCEKPAIEFNDPSIILDASSQTISLSTNTGIGTMFVKDVNSDRYINYVLSGDGRIVTCKGDWFDATLDFNSPEEISLAIDRNITGKDRKIRIEVQRFGKGTSVDITQKSI